METHEIIGWIGNLFVVIQFLMSDMKKLRLYGLVGAILWLVVGILIDNMPLIILNILIMGIQIYHLNKLYKE